MPAYARRDYPPAPQDKVVPSPTTPAAVTGIEYPSPVDAPTEVSSARPPRGFMSRAFYNHHNTASSTIDDVVAPPPGPSLDHIWGTIRQQKERKMAKERPKVQSLEEMAHEQDLSSSDPPHIQIPVQSQGSVPKSMKKQKSISNIRESTDGQSIVATFDMPPEVAKQDVHLSFQRNRLVIRWVTVELEEWEEDGVIMRERIEKHFNRTLPLPEGTRFEEIQATMNDHDRRLILRYPNMRCFRIDRLSRSGDS